MTFGRLVRAEGARDGIEDVSRRDHAVEVSILIVHEGHWHLGFTQHIERIQRIEGVGNDWRLTDVILQVELLALEQGAEQLPDLDNADHVVGAAFTDGQARMRRVKERLADLDLWPGEVDPVHIGARGHNTPDRAICEPSRASSWAAAGVL